MTPEERQRQAIAEARASRDRKSASQRDLPSDFILTTETTLTDVKVEERFGVVTAECVFGMHALKDAVAGARDIFGGRSEAFQKTLREAREIALAELKREAHARGANAVIAVDLDYSEISARNSMLMLIASGTAVRLESAASH